MDPSPSVLAAALLLAPACVSEVDLSLDARRGTDGPFGDSRWADTAPGHHVHRVAWTDTGDLLTSGYVADDDSPPLRGSLTRYDTAGAVRWDVSLPDTEAGALAPTVDGGLVVAVRPDWSSWTARAPHLAWYDPDGALQASWRPEAGGAAGALQHVEAVIGLADGAVAFTGYTAAGSAGRPTPVVGRVDAGAELQWLSSVSPRHVSLADGGALDLALAPDGDLLVLASYTPDTNRPREDGWAAYVTRVEPDGRIAWQVPLGGSVRGRRIRGTASGSILVLATFDTFMTVGEARLESPDFAREMVVAELDGDGGVRGAHILEWPAGLDRDQLSFDVTAADLVGDRLVVSGSYDGRLDPYTMGLFVAEYDLDGRLRHERQLRVDPPGSGAFGKPLSVALAVSSAGDVVHAGEYTGTADLGAGPLGSGVDRSGASIPRPYLIVFPAAAEVD